MLCYSCLYKFVFSYITFSLPGPRLDALWPPLGHISLPSGPPSSTFRLIWILFSHGMAPLNPKGTHLGHTKKYSELCPRGPPNTCSTLQQKHANKNWTNVTHWPPKVNPKRRTSLFLLQFCLLTRPQDNPMQCNITPNVHTNPPEDARIDYRKSLSLTDLAILPPKCCNSAKLQLKLGVGGVPPGHSMYTYVYIYT